MLFVGFRTDFVVSFSYAEVLVLAGLRPAGANKNPRHPFRPPPSLVTSLPRCEENQAPYFTMLHTLRTYVHYDLTQISKVATKFSPANRGKNLFVAQIHSRSRIIVQLADMLFVLTHFLFIAKHRINNTDNWSDNQDWNFTVSQYNIISTFASISYASEGPV